MPFIFASSTIKLVMPFFILNDKEFKAIVIEITSVSQAEEEIKAVGVDSEYAVKLMANKTIFRVIKVNGVRNAMANILKQEMLSIGGDVAVHKDCVNCKVEKTDVIIMGTLRQFRMLITRMKIQVAESKAVINAIEKALNESLK